MKNYTVEIGEIWRNKKSKLYFIVKSIDTAYVYYSFVKSINTDVNLYKAFKATKPFKKNSNYRDKKSFLLQFEKVIKVGELLFMEK